MTITSIFITIFPQQFGQHVTLLPSTCITLIPTAKGLIWMPDKIN